jgi:hypothetical protein
MRTSVRRQCLRQQLGVSRKLTVTRWIGQLTVRVRISGVTPRGCAYVKASEGVEKSCGGKPRRRRGLRRGSKRSRGGKPPLNSCPPAPKSGTFSARVISHNERMFVFARRAQSRFLGEAERTLRYGFPQEGTDRWFTLRDKWRSYSHGFPILCRTLVFGPTFSEFMRRMRILQQEDAEPPPLPPRGPRPPPLPTRPVEVPVPVGGFTSHTERDQYGPNPCAFCRAAWMEDGEIGLCLRIQLCVRNPRTIARREQETRLHRSKTTARLRRGRP